MIPERLLLEDARDVLLLAHPPYSCDDLAELALMELALKELTAMLADVRRGVQNQMANLMESKQAVIDGVGVFQRNRRAKRSWTAEQKKELAHYVLDSRLVDKETGEIKHESREEKLLSVFALGDPRVGELKERGIDPSDWCSWTEEPGYTIQVISETKEKNE